MAGPRGAGGESTIVAMGFLGNPPNKGVLGALLIKLNVQVAIIRRNSPLRNMPLFEVLIGAAITAIVSWPVSPIKLSLDSAMLI